MKSDAIIGAVTDVTKKWAKQRKREEREKSAILNRRYALLDTPHVSQKEAAWQIMETAYLKASANGTLPAHARQIMYAARGHIQRMADKPLGKGFDKYFTQTLLPDYIAERGVDWNVVWDARGHFHEPHTRLDIPLGTLQVRKYLRQVQSHQVEEFDFTLAEERYPTLGPRHRFGAILFIEKEGFMPLFDAVNLAARYDLAIMSTKGMSVTASRELVEALCADHGVPLLVLHDFDVSGFTIFGTIRANTRRYTYRRKIDVMDLGLRIEDIDGLETEDVHIPSPAKTRTTLRRHGATRPELDFLMQRRVELNALPSDELIALIERKLENHGVKKIVPDDETLADAYRRMHRQAVVQARIREALKTLHDADVAVPSDLRSRIQTRQADRPEQRWDAIIQNIARKDFSEEAGQ
jgi:hypothetical protein